MNPFHPALLTGCALFLSAGSALAVSAPAFDRPPENVRQLQLDNGLDVLLIRLPSVPLVGLSTQVRVGSVMEDWSTSGMSHMLEHLLFNGTEHRTQKELYDEVDRLGGYNNAHTSDWFTNYMMLVPPEHLEQGMDIQSDMLFFSTLPPEKFDKERGIVLEEIAQGRDGLTDLDRMRSDWRRTLLAGSSHELPTIGTPQTIHAITRDQVYSFYKDWYRPNNAVLTVMGPIEFDSAIDALQRTYGRALPGPLPAFEPLEARLPLGERSSRLAQIDAPVLWLAWEFPDRGHAAHLEARAFAEALAHPEMGLLSQALFMQGLPPFARLQVQHHASLGAGRLEVEAEIPLGLAPEDAAQGLIAALRLCSELDPGEELLPRWVLAQRSSEALLREKPHYFGMSHAADLVQGGIDPLLQLDRRLASMQVQEVQETAADWLAAEPAQRLALPARGQKGPAASADGELAEFTLDSGARLSLRCNTESEVFSLALLLRDRNAWEGESRSGAIDLLHRLWADSPAMRELQALGATLDLHDQAFIPYDDYRTSPLFSFVRLEVLAERSEEAIGLLFRMLRDTDIEEEALEEQKQKALRRLMQREAKASALSRRLAGEALLAPSPSARHAEGSREGIEATNVQDLLALRAALLQPGNLVLALNTPHSLGDTRGLLEKQLPSSSLDEDVLAHLRGLSIDLREQDSCWSPRKADAPRSTTEREIRRQLGSAQASLRLVTRFESRPEDAAALRVLFSILSDRMAFDLRETEGWAYSIGAGISSRKGVSSATAAMGTRPENLEAALKGMKRHLQDFKVRELSEEELQRTVNSLQGRDRMRRMSSVNQCWYRATALLGDGDSEEKPPGLADVRLEDLRRLARETLPELNWITVIVE